MINIQELRKKGADQAFREYKFPEGCIVKDTGDWDVQHNEWKREVTTNEYVCGFIVRFPQFQKSRVCAWPFRP